MSEKIIATLSTFSDKQLKELHKYLRARHGEESDLMRIFVFYKNKGSSLENSTHTNDIRSEHFSHIKHKRFLNLHSSLNTLIENYLIIDYIDADPDRRNLILNKIYNDSGQFDRADQKARRLQNSIEQLEGFSLEKQEKLTKLYHQQYYSDNPIKYKEGDHFLRQLVKKNLIKSKIQLLLYKCELVNWGKIRRYNYNDEIATISEITNLIEDTTLTTQLRSLEHLLIKPNIKDFLSLRKVLYADKFSAPSILHTIFTMYLLNSSMKLWHLNLYNDSDESVKLFEYALNSGVLLYNGKIPIVRFHNLISTLGALKSNDWTEAFIEKWKNTITGKKVDSTVMLARAQNAFEHEDYVLIRPLIRGLEYDTSNQKVRALGLELVVLFIERKQDYALLRNFIGNYKRTLKRLKSSVSDHFYESHLNLVKVVELLVKRDFTRVTIHLNNYKAIVYRTWLTKQI